MSISISTESPLLDSDLEAAAYLCLRAASLTDRDQFPRGSGDAICRQLHARRKRFEDAREKSKKGANSILDLGLSPEDLAWATKQADRAKDKKGWKLRFKTAETRLCTAQAEKRPA
jgi:hypothetical protein